MTLPRLTLFTVILCLFITTLLSPSSIHAATICPPGLTVGVCNFVDSLFQNPSVTTPSVWYNQSLPDFQKKVFDTSNTSDIFGERYTFAQVNWIINSLFSTLVPNVSTPADVLKILENLIKVSQQPNPFKADAGFRPYAQLGVPGLLTGGISALYANPPVSGIEEVKTTAYRVFDLGTGAQPALAQGFGYSGLNAGGGVRALWIASRNMSYFIIAVILVASGFMIMFRIKINPQTVVSLQTMIPKLITTMLLVTFSFAIAGFIMDLVYVVIVAFVGLLGLAGNNIITNVPASLSTIANSDYLSYIFIQAPGSIILLLVGVTVIVLSMIIGLLGLPGIAVGVFVALLGLWAVIILFKIFAMMFKAYVTIILLVIVGPFQIMLDLIPGQQGFGPWFRNIFANASVFATVAIMLIIQHIISGNPVSDFLNCVINKTNTCLYISNTYSSAGGTGLQMPFFNVGWGNGGAASVGNFFFSLLTGFTIFSLTPKFADMIRDALKIPAFKYGAAVSEAFHGVTAAPRGAISSRGERIEQEVGDELRTSGPSSATQYKAGVAKLYKQLGK